MRPIKKVLIFGGTHGNEWTGVTVVQEYAENLQARFPELTLEFILANPEAHALNQRYKDEDLNRAFQFLNESRPLSFEHRRAHEIKKLIEKEPCLVIDLHTTTSQMGKTVIVSDYNHFNLSLCEAVEKNFPNAHIIGSPDPHKKYLASQSPFALVIEVGPIPQGLRHAETLEGTLQLLEVILSKTLDYRAEDKGSLWVFEEVQEVKYPLNEKGVPKAYIHSEFQGKNFSKLSGNFAPFRSYSGEILWQKTDEELYPIFINEAAYYPQHLAFTLCRKKKLTF